jgi:hypothetical protein
MMNELRDALEARLKLGLKADARVDRDGTLHGRIFIENVSFGTQFSLIQMRDWTKDAEEECEVSVRTDLLPKVNDLAKYFPFTTSNKVVREVDRITRETIARSLGKSIAVVMDNTVGINAAYLVGTLGGLCALMGYVYGLLLSASSNGGLEGAAVGGTLGAGTMVVLIFRYLD